MLQLLQLEDEQATDHVASLLQLLISPCCWCWCWSNQAGLPAAAAANNDSKAVAALRLLQPTMALVLIPTQKATHTAF